MYIIQLSVRRWFSSSSGYTRSAAPRRIPGKPTPSMPKQLKIRHCSSVDNCHRWNAVSNVRGPIPDLGRKKLIENCSWWVWVSVSVTCCWMSCLVLSLSRLLAWYSSSLSAFSRPMSAKRWSSAFWRSWACWHSDSRRASSSLMNRCNISRFCRANSRALHSPPTDNNTPKPLK